MGILRKIYRDLFPQKLSREAFEAYYHRLPDRISVSWERDGKYIVGRVSDGSHEFVTQGKNTDDFIEMVNDALITVYDIPNTYIAALKEVNRTYVPSPEVRKALDNVSIGNAKFSFIKNEEVLRSA